MDPRARSARTPTRRSSRRRSKASSGAPDQIDELVKQYSEDPGLARRAIRIRSRRTRSSSPSSRALALHLKEKEVGIVKTSYGYHVMERVLRRHPTRSSSADILARQPETGTVNVQHVLIGWKDTPAAKAGRVDRQGEGPRQGRRRQDRARGPRRRSRPAATWRSS